MKKLRSRNRLSPVHLVLLLGVASVVRIASAEVDSSTAAASSNQQYQTPKDHLTPPPQRQTIRQYIQSNLLPHRLQEPSFIQRVARFFGFDYGRKVYPPAPPAQAPGSSNPSPVKFQSTERGPTEYNTYTPNPNYNTNYNPNIYGPYPNGPGQQYQQNPQQQYQQQQPQPNANPWSPNNLNNYQNNNPNQQYNNYNPNQNQPQPPQYQGQQIQAQNQPQFNGQKPNEAPFKGPSPQNQQQFINYPNQQQNQFDQNQISNNKPQGPPFPYQYQTYGPPAVTNQQQLQQQVPQPPPASDSYQFLPSQQFQPSSFGANGFQPVQQQQLSPAGPPAAPPQIITPPPTPPANAYLPARNPHSARQMAESFDFVPCNQSPWVPMYNGREIVNRPEKFLESTYLGPSQKHQHAHNNYYPTPPPRQPAQFVKLNPNANTWAHQVSSDLIVGTPKLQGFYSTPSSINKVVTSPEYLPPPGNLPIQQQRHHPLAPIPIPNLSVTAIPPLYEYRPFGNSNGNGQFSGAASQGQQGGGGGGVTNIIIGTNVGHPNAQGSGSGFGSNLKIVSSSGALVGNGPTTAAPYITNGGAGGYQYPPPQNQLNIITPAVTNSHAGYQYPKPNVIPDLGGRSSGKLDPKSQVESVEQIGNNAYRSADLYNDFEIIKSIPILQFSTAVEGESKNAPGTGNGALPPQLPKLPPGAQPEKVQHHNQHQQSNHKSQQEEDQMGLTVQPIVVGNQKREEKLTDSYTAASSHNFTIREEGSEDLPINYVTEPPNYIYEEDTEHTEFGVTEGSVNIPKITPPQPPKKDRDTPKELLDSPLFYLRGSPKPFTRDPSNPRLPPHEEHFPSSKRPATMPDWIKSSPFREPPAFYTTTAPQYPREGSDGKDSGMAPPPPPMTVDSINLITKRPKQIQIIIPYTTNNRPSPFRTLDDSEMRGEVRVGQENYEKWANFNQELHNEEESKIVTATEAAGPRKTTKFLTKILASSIRDLLNNERENSKRPIDIFALQKNIDDWTEQEFSVEPHKASTISLAAKSKTIPDEYLTTTPSMRDLLATTTNGDWYDEEATTSPPSYYEEQLQNDQHVADNNQIVQVHENYLGNAQLEEEEEKQQQQQQEEEGMAGEGSYWNKFKLAISPMTQEKVYVVTPQPPWDRQLVFNNADEIEVEEEHKSSYKKPRLMARPTAPGKPKGGMSYILGLTLSQSVNNLQPGEESTPKPITPELFGKLGGHEKSPFDITDHEEIHSFTKRITIVTASPIGRKFEKKENRKV